MSKEQTPIEELVIRLADLYTDLGNAKRPDQGMKLVSIISKEIELYAQAKVLEALQIIKTLTDNNVSVTSEHIDNLIISKTKV